jgi:hypothetical protein
MWAEDMMMTDLRTCGQRGVAAATAAILAFILAGCSGNASPTAPTPGPPPPPANVAPTIGSMNVTNSAYRTARVTASASDSDGQVASGTVDWGDGTTSNVTSGFGSVSMTHQYGQAQSYTVTFRVLDNGGLSTQASRSVTITVPPEACVGIRILDVCARTTADFRNLRLAVKSGEIVLAQFTIDNGNASPVRVPLALGFGALTFQHNFNTGRLTITGEVCTVPFLVCEPVGSPVILQL